MASHREKLPNLKICLDNTEDDNEIDEELSVDDNSSDVEMPEIVANDDTENVEFNVKLSGVQSDVNKKTKSKTKPEFSKKYENKAGNFVTGIDITSKETQEKKKERAQRFGLPITDEEEAKIDLAKLYASLGINEDDVHKGERGIRLEAIHLRGTDNMSTQDVFKYFNDFAPGAVEWIDDASCNVVWLDTVTAARAMMKLSNSHDTATDLLEEHRKSRKQKSSSINKDESKLKDIEMEEHSKDNETTNNPELKSATVDQQMEVEEDDDDLDLCDDDEPKLMEAVVPVVIQEPKTSEPPVKKDEKSQGSDRMKENDSDSRVEDNTADKEGDELDDKGDNSDHDSSSDEKRQNDVRSENDDATIKKTEKDETFSSNRTSIPCPPGKWRLGIECYKAKYIFMRFATKADKKIHGAEKKSRYYQKYGNPNYGGMKGLISGTRKRKFRSRQYRDEIDEAHDAVLSHRLSKKNDDDQVTDDVPDDEPEEGEIVDSDDDHEVAPVVKISPLNRDKEDIKVNSYKDDDDDELDMDAELEQLLASPPKKRTMRMYADDEEEHLKAKRIARSGIFTIMTDIQDSIPSKQSMGKIKDARELIKQAASRPKFISDSNNRNTNDLRSRILNKRQNRINYCSESDDENVDDADSDNVRRSDLRLRLRVSRTRDTESPSMSRSFAKGQSATKTSWSELSRGERGRNGRADESGGRTLIKYESDSDDDVSNSDVTSRVAGTRKTASDNSGSSSEEQETKTAVRKHRTKFSDSSSDSDMESDSESSSDDNVRNADLRSRLVSRKKPNSDYPSMRIEVLD